MSTTPQARPTIAEIKALTEWLAAGNQIPNFTNTTFEEAWDYYLDAYSVESEPGAGDACTLLETLSTWEDMA